jgi:hypothetical protein
MSEEQQEGGLSGLKKTILGVAGTAVTGFGIWASTNINKIFGVEEESDVKTEQVQQVQQQPAAAPVVINLENNNTQQQSSGGGAHTREIIREVPAQQPAAAPAPVVEKKETPAERIARLKAEKEAKNAGGQ